MREKSCLYSKTNMSG